MLGLVHTDISSVPDGQHIAYAYLNVYLLLFIQTYSNPSMTLLQLHTTCVSVTDCLSHLVSDSVCNHDVLCPLPADAAQHSQNPDQGPDSIILLLNQ